MSTGNALSWTSSTVARFRDAVRTLRGKRPKYTALARQMETEQHVAYYHWTNPVRGICNEADIQHGVLAPDEREFFEHLLADACQRPGPIVQFGTLLGHTIDLIGTAKPAQQKVITIDPAFSNPWKLSADVYRALSERLLHRWLADGTLTQFSASPREYFRTYRGTPPALVFLNYVNSYDDARRIIRWAKTIGAEAIAGRGYDFAFADVMQAVDESGGPDAVEGNLWRLRQKTAAPCEPPSMSSSPVAAPLSNPQQPASGLVSIVMPAYNSRKFINPTLSDISRQIYCDWELIVVEDGSDNPIGDVIERFRTKHPRHRIVYHAKPFNSGVSSTRNVAFRLCHGEFIAFLDADDRWCPDHLQRKVRLLRKTGCDLAYSRVDAFDSASDKSLCFWGPTDEELEKFPASMFNRPYMQPSGMVVHRSLVDDVGDFDEKLHFAEDYDYHFRAIRAGKLFCFDEKVTSRYRKNHASAATTDRMVVCCQGAAEVASRHFALLKGDDAEARRVTAKHFMMAGTGHLGFRPTTRNRCDPVVGRHCLAEALRVGGKTRSERKYAFLARVAATTRTTALFRPIFRRRYQRFWN